jgi:hypothetical protein
MFVRIYHHLGLGDHIICNGLIRYISKTYSVALVVKHKNLTNVARMFRDCKIMYAPIINDNDNIYGKGNLGWCFGGDTSINFDESFYKQAGVPFEHRWKSFYIQRDYAKEKAVSSYLKLPKKFCLVHNQASAGKVDINVKTDLPIIYMNKTPVEETMFDWMGVIEQAAEIHCINSSFIHLVDSMEPTAKLYFYDDRPQLPFAKKLKWQVYQLNKG